MVKHYCSLCRASSRPKPNQHWLVTFQKTETDQRFHAVIFIFQMDESCCRVWSEGFEVNLELL
jgi:hypothetical protein